jgi:hypothetical protein
MPAFPLAPTDRGPFIRLLALGLAAALAVGCGPGEDGPLPDDEGEPVVDGDLWQQGDAEEPAEPGKEDAVSGVRGVPTSADAASTAVWAVKRQWAEKVNVDFPPYFRKADNITWNEAFRRFIDNLESTDAVDGYRTYKITNPWGKTLPIPVLECAEQAMFIRVTFSAWFNLPFFLEAVDGKRVRMFAGHFGFRTMTGKYSNFPDFKTAYADTSARPPASLASWPKDTRLRARKLGGDDTQPFLASTATFGTYLDELHLNKRAGHFTALVLLWFGSVNLADPANTFHLKPAAIRPGDVQLERWQRAGIGHTLIVKEVRPLAEGKLSVELASGSMPRRQAVWENAVTSRRYFLLDYAGGEGASFDGIPFARLGGGIRRWRVPAVFGGAWVNMVPGESASAWINSTDYAAIAARPAEFGRILDVPPATERRRDLVTALEEVRVRQLKTPASCSAREKREGLIRDLADLESEDRGWSRDQTERAYRKFADYVFPQLTYEASKTCCWNTTTQAMGEMAVAFNQKRQNDAQACLPPIPMMNDGGYAAFKAYAVSIGRGAEWRDWSEDEPCPQRAVARDTIDASVTMANYCDLRSGL